ncbi:UNVERIFIED_CONTAM: hypothetical protein FKN15_004632 [Acipenser sinensis]
MFEQGEVEIQRRPSSSGLLSPAAFINPAQYNNVLEGRFKQLQGSDTRSECQIAASPEAQAMLADIMQPASQCIPGLRGESSPCNHMDQQYEQGPTHCLGKQPQGLRNEINAFQTSRWREFQNLANQKKKALTSALNIQNYHLECNEIKSWMREKTKVIESTQGLGNDLAGVMALQRKLTGMERDLEAIQGKLDDLNQEATKLGEEHPSQKPEIQAGLAEIQEVWEDLNNTMKAREESLGEAGKIQGFLRDLDDFQSWLSRTQTAIASEDNPTSLTEAERLLAQHQNIRNEVDNYKEDYQKMRAVGEEVTQGQTDAQHMFLSQRLQALDTGWNELRQMWENRRHLLAQAFDFQTFLRDVKQAEGFLNNQEYVLSHTEMPSTLQGAEAAIKKHEDFLTTMDASEDKISGVEGKALVCEKPELEPVVTQKLADLHRLWEELESTTQTKAQCLFDANRAELFTQSCSSLDSWLKNLSGQLQSDDFGKDLTSVNILLQKQQMLENQMEVREKEVEALQSQALALSQDDSNTVEVDTKQRGVQDRFQLLLDPLRARRMKLLASKEEHQFNRDLEDEILWVKERMPLATSMDHGKDLPSVQLLMKKNQVHTQSPPGQTVCTRLHAVVLSIEFQYSWSPVEINHFIATLF